MIHQQDSNWGLVMSVDRERRRVGEARLLLGMRT